MSKYKFNKGDLVEVLENKVEAPVGVRSKTVACFRVCNNIYYKLKTGHFVPEESLKLVRGEKKDMFKKKEKYNFDKNKKYTKEEIEEMFEKAERKVLDDLRKCIEKDIVDPEFKTMNNFQNMLVMGALYSLLFQE